MLGFFAAVVFFLIAWRVVGFVIGSVRDRRMSLALRKKTRVEAQMSRDLAVPFETLWHGHDEWTVRIEFSPGRWATVRAIMLENAYRHCLAAAMAQNERV